MSDEIIGYCDPHGNFMGYDPRMTLVPGLIPAKYKADGSVNFIGNPRVVPKGSVLETESGFGNGPEKVLSGMVEDRGADLAPTGSIPGSMPPEQLEEILGTERTAAAVQPDGDDTDESDAIDAVNSALPEPDPALADKIAARKSALASAVKVDGDDGGPAVKPADKAAAKPAAQKKAASE